MYWSGSSAYVNLSTCSSRCVVRSSFYLETSRSRVLIEIAKLPTWVNNSLRVQSSHKGPRKCTEACLAASNMWSQLWRTLGRWELQHTVRLRWELRDKLSAWPPAVPFNSLVITGFIVITACFLKGQASQGNNPPVSTHINGLIGLFSPSQNADLSLTEMLSPQSPSCLNSPEMHDVSAKWSCHYPALSRSFTLLSFLFFFFLLSVSLHHAVRHLWHQLGGNFSGFKLRLKVGNVVVNHNIYTGHDEQHYIQEMAHWGGFLGILPVFW